MTAPLLEVRDLVIEFDTRQGRRRVVDQVSLTLNAGEVLGILGESGSGKTLTTLAVLGLVSGHPGVLGGSITLNDGQTAHHLLDGLSEMVHRRGDQLVKSSRRWNRHVHQRMAPLWGRMMTAVFQNPRHSLDPLMTIGAQVEESIALSERFERRRPACEGDRLARSGPDERPRPGACVLRARTLGRHVPACHDRGRARAAAAPADRR